LEAEDLARARWYGFFSRWFLAPPDQQALDVFLEPADGADAAALDPVTAVASSAPEPAADDDTASTDTAPTSTWLESAWQAFSSAVARESLDDIRAAYDDTFISVGEAPVSLHASVYLTGFANERPLAEVRRWLAEQGIQSSRAGLLTEDHLGLLCEAMAWLIIGNSNDEHEEAGRDRSDGHGARAGGSDEAQRHLFLRYISTVCDDFCHRLSETPGAGIYRELGHLFAAFCAVERQAFEIER
jgi:TorA maturation chaperone TorD